MSFVQPTTSARPNIAYHLKPAQTLTIVRNIRKEIKVLMENEMYTEALEKYNLAIKALNQTDTERRSEAKKMNRLRLDVVVDMAACLFKLDRPEEVVELFQSLNGYTHIKLRKHCKAMFYYAKAYEMIDRPEKAIYNYYKALQIEPNNKEVKDALETLQKAQREIIIDDLEDYDHRLTCICRRMIHSRELLVYELPLCLTDDDIEYVKMRVEDYGSLGVCIEYDELMVTKTSIKIVKKHDPKYFHKLC